MLISDDTNKYRRILDCPMCGSGQTHFIKKLNKMQCDKCGNQWQRPPFPK